MAEMHSSCPIGTTCAEVTRQEQEQKLEAEAEAEARQHTAQVARRRMQTARTSRFSMLLEDNVDYAVYRTVFGRQFLQQQPKFDSLQDAETELECVLHDDAFAQQQEASEAPAVVAENVALAIDWYISALVLLFDGDEPFQNPDFLRFCCLFFASPLYENNTRLVQRHLVKRTYAELSTGPADNYGDSLWILLALMHLITEFQHDTYLLCKDSGIFPLLQRLISRSPERHLNVLAMSLMFEIAQAVPLAKPDLFCINDKFLESLLEYIEAMRYAESDVYNNTGTKLVVALNEQFLRHTNKMLFSATNGQPPPAPPREITTSMQNGWEHGASVDMPAISSRSTGRHQQMPPIPTAMRGPNCLPLEPRPSHHTRTVSACFPATPCSSGSNPTAEAAYCADQPQQQQQQQHEYEQTRQQNVLANDIDNDSHFISRSRSMDFNAPLHSQSGSPLDRRIEESQPAPQSHSRPLIATATPVVTILAQRTDCCKTFTENLIFLLNRESEPITQTLILNMLACILGTDSTSDILYTNDMHVLVDILIRDLSNLSEGSHQRLRQAYLHVVCALLRNRVFLAARHRLSDIELCLVNILRQSLICSQSSSLSSSEPLGAKSRRDSASSSSTRHNSMVSTDLSILVTGANGNGNVNVNGRGSHEIRREHSRAESPVSSRSSVISEETCCTRQPDDNGVQNQKQHQQQHRRQSIDKPPKAMRRPAPPPPQPTSPLHDSKLLSPEEVSPGSPPLSSTRPHSQRRRAPPPPPPPRPSYSSSSRSSHLSRVTSARDLPQLKTVNEGIAMDDYPSNRSGSAAPGAVPPRRKAPPPPPPLPPRTRLPSRGARVPSNPGASNGLDNSSNNNSSKQHQSTDPPAVLPRRGNAQPTGLRRQLSVKKSVTKYKLRSTRPPPPPPPTPPPPPVSLATTPVSPRDTGLAAGGEVLTGNGASRHPFGTYPDRIEQLAAHDVSNTAATTSDEDDLYGDGDPADMQSTAAYEHDGDSVEERRITRKLVESALRSCHEARHFAVTRGLVVGPTRIET
ncbi:pre-rRNA processing [Coemansia sp. Benny D160-2]|nr:pre-rRNA processing [Coemansia sp. Benny D160-2]